MKKSKHTSKIVINKLGETIYKLVETYPQQRIVVGSTRIDVEIDRAYFSNIATIVFHYDYISIETEDWRYKTERNFKTVKEEIKFAINQFLEKGVKFYEEYLEKVIKKERINRYFVPAIIKGGVQDEDDE